MVDVVEACSVLYALISLHSPKTMVHPEEVPEIDVIQLLVTTKLQYQTEKRRVSTGFEVV